MDGTLMNPFLYIFIFLLSWYVFSRFNQVKKKLPPGPIRWPIVGSVPQMMMIHPYHHYLQLMGMHKKYGDIYGIGVGQHYMVVVSSYELIKDLFKRTEATYERYIFQFANQRSNWKNLGLLWCNGETWFELRKFTIRKLRDYGFGRGNHLEENIQDEIELFLDEIQNEKNGVWEVEPYRVSVMMLNIIWSSVGNYRFDPKGQIIKQTLQIYNDVGETFSAGNLLSKFPFLRIFPKWSGFARDAQMHETCRKYTKELIADARKRRDGRIEPESFIEYFLDEIEKHKDTNRSEVFSEDQLVLLLMDFFSAGTDTTSTSIRWLTTYFTLFPKIQEKAREEILLASENGTNYVKVGQLSRLPYMKACILETFRFALFGPTPIARCASQDMQISGYTIPKGACLQMFLYAVFRDEKYWGDQEIFRPERFFNDDGITLDPSKTERIIQFGLGRRVCPAEEISYETITAFFVNLLSSYEIVPVPGKGPNLNESVPGLAFQPAPCTVQLKPLKTKAN